MGVYDIILGFGVRAMVLLDCVEESDELFSVGGLHGVPAKDSMGGFCRMTLAFSMIAWRRLMLLRRGNGVLGN